MGGSVSNLEIWERDILKVFHGVKYGKQDLVFRCILSHYDAKLRNSPGVKAFGFVPLAMSWAGAHVIEACQDTCRPPSPRSFLPGWDLQTRPPVCLPCVSVRGWPGAFRVTFLGHELSAYEDGEGQTQAHQSGLQSPVNCWLPVCLMMPLSLNVPAPSRHTRPFLPARPAFPLVRTLDPSKIQELPKRKH